MNFGDNRKTICFDFDGVIHSYISGWKGITVIPDPPVIGIREFIKKVIIKYKIVIFSARAESEEGRTAIACYMRDNDIPFDYITCKKLPAILYVDDRAIRFLDVETLDRYFVKENLL